MKKLLFIFLIFSNCFASADKKFELVMQKPQEKGASKNNLKEQIGDKLKLSLDGCASVVEKVGDIIPQLTKKFLQDGFEDVACINKSTGEILKIVGGLQRGFSTKAQLLVENSRPFKKASKVNLEGALEVINDVSKMLKEQETALANLGEQLGLQLKSSDNKKALHAMKNVGSSLSARVEIFKKIQDQIAGCDCLK